LATSDSAVSAGARRKRFYNTALPRAPEPIELLHADFALDLTLISLIPREERFARLRPEE